MHKLAKFLIPFLLISKLCFGYASLDFVSASSHKVSMGDVTTFDGATALSMYVRYDMDSHSTADRFISKWSSTTSNQSFLLTVNGTDSTKLRCALSNGSADLIWDSPTSTLSNGVGDVACTWTTMQTVKMYLNGSDVGATITTAANIPSVQNSSVSLEIGYETAESRNGIDGRMSFAAIWKRVLSPDEIWLLHLGFDPRMLPGGPPDGLWPLQGDANDYSGNANHGTITGATGSNDGYPSILGDIAL